MGDKPLPGPMMTNVIKWSLVTIYKWYIHDYKTARKLEVFNNPNAQLRNARLYICVEKNIRVLDFAK